MTRLFFRIFDSIGLLFVLLGPVISCAAHPDLIEQISKLTEQLESEGESAALHVQRGDLYRRHGRFTDALMDIAAAEKLETNSPALLLAKARIFGDAGMARPALATIQQFLQSETNHAEALFIRARSEAQLGRPEAAISDYTAAINLCSSPMLDLYLERARQQALLGKLDEAVQGLDKAMARTSALPALQIPAIEYDRQRKAFDSALSRVDEFVNRYPVKEPWLTLRAEILEQAGRTQQAEQTFKRIIAGIEKYPGTRRNLDLTKQLETRARAGLARTQSRSTAS